MVRVAIVGPTGYTAYEAIRILLRHPEAEIAALASRREPQPEIAEIFPQLRGVVRMRCEPIDPETIARKADVAVLCLPHRVAMEFVPAFLKAGLRVIDLSADYRLKDPHDYKRWYDHEHTDVEHLSEAVYGLPEYYREQVRSARLVANPGCYPTGAILAAGPFLKAGLVEPGDVIVYAASGITGAGREPKPAHYFPERNETFEPYSVGTHRHGIEIQRVLEDLAGGPASVAFVPHLVPMNRGILSTVFLRPKRPISIEHASSVLAETYADEPFVRLREDLPGTRDVAGSNFCDITVRIVSGWVVVISAIDNLVKGASGQAIQNLNIMFGLDERAGLV